MPHNNQVLITATCLDYKNQPAEMQRKIRNLCAEVGGLYFEPLFAIMTKGKSITAASIDTPCDKTTLVRVRQKFYERWKD